MVVRNLNQIIDSYITSHVTSCSNCASGDDLIATLQQETVLARNRATGFIDYIITWIKLDKPANDTPSLLEEISGDNLSTYNLLRHIETREAAERHIRALYFDLLDRFMLEDVTTRIHPLAGERSMIHRKLLYHQLNPPEIIDYKSLNGRQIFDLSAALGIAINRYLERNFNTEFDGLMWNLLTQSVYRRRRRKLILQHAGQGKYGVEIYVDLNALKRFNDEFGHDKYGDLLLSCFNVAMGEVGNWLQEKKSWMIHEESLLLGRDGGDEMGIFFVTDKPDEVEAIADEVYTTLSTATYEKIKKVFLLDTDESMEDKRGEPITQERIIEALEIPTNLIRPGYYFAMSATCIPLDTKPDWADLLAAINKGIDMSLTQEVVSERRLWPGISPEDRLYALSQEARLSQARETGLVVSKVLSKPIRRIVAAKFLGNKAITLGAGYPYRTLRYIWETFISLLPGRDPVTPVITPGNRWHRITMAPFSDEIRALAALGLPDYEAIEKHFETLIYQCERIGCYAIIMPSSPYTDFDNQYKIIYHLAHIFSAAGLQGSIR